MLSLKPYLRSFLERLETALGSAFHCLSSKVMGSEGFFPQGKEGVESVLNCGDRGFGDDGGKSVGFVSHHEIEW